MQYICQNEPNLNKTPFFFFTFSPLRIAYLGLTLSLRTVSFIICIPGFILLSRQLKEEEKSAVREALSNGGAELETLRKDEFAVQKSDQTVHTSGNGTDPHSRLWLPIMQKWLHFFIFPPLLPCVCHLNPMHTKFVQSYTINMHLHSTEICREPHVAFNHLVYSRKIYICTTECVEVVRLWQKLNLFLECALFLFILTE